MTLEEKIKDKLFQQVGQLGFFGCWQMINDDNIDILDKHELAEVIGDTLASLIDYSSINDYINETPTMRTLYYEQLKSGIIHFKDSYEIDTDYIEVDIELTEDEIAELTEIIES